MATRIKIGLFIVLAGIVVVAAFAARRTEGAGNEFRFNAAQLKDKTTWTQVNAEPYFVSSQVAIQCAAPTAADYERERRDPHMRTYITVYVNRIGRKAMFSKNPKFPEGSVIVKEKSNTEGDSHKPVLYTIMRKREAGYNPKVGDWEFSVVAANGTDMQVTGKLEKCQSCHVGVPDRDFIFRDYLSSLNY